MTILGDAFNGVELWQTGIRLIGTDVPTDTELSAVNDAVATFLATLSLAFPQGRRYVGLKWAPQDINGHYPDGEDSVEWLRPTPLVGSSGTGYPQIALVLSLRTARSRGYASNGRMYFPSAPTIDTGLGKIPTTATTNVATAGATLMAAIRDSGVGIPAVMSAVGAGRTEAVTSCRVGRVLDTQRRRRNALDEDYSAEISVPI